MAVTDEKNTNGVSDDLLKTLAEHTVKAHKERESKVDKVLRWFPLVLAFGTVMLAAVAFWDRIDDHVEERAAHFLPTVEGEKKEDFAKVVFVESEMEDQIKELDRLIEVQQIKQELQVRKALQEYRENFNRFKRNTRALEEEVDEVGGLPR